MTRSALACIGVWLIAVLLCGAGPESTRSKKAAAPQTQKDQLSSDAARGRQPNADTPIFPLTEKNGPWMVLVKSFQGPQAIELANQLAQELRAEHQVPTYVLVKRAEQPQDLARGRVRSYDGAAVLAGDFADENDKNAVKLREKIRKIRPKCITEDMTSKYRWAVGVLTTAALVPNPLQPRAAIKKTDPALLNFNSGEYSLLKCPGEYTLQVRSFTGALSFGDDPLVSAEAKKLQHGRPKKSLLEAGGEYADQITQELRRQGIEAYVFHGESSSIVCVGSFSSPDDPRILDVYKEVAGKKVIPNPGKKVIPNPGTNRTGFSLSSNPLIMAVPRK